MIRLYYLLLISFLIVSCTSNPSRIIFSESDQFGIKKQNGKTVTKQLYDEIIPCDLGKFYKAKKGRYWGLLTKNGKELTEFKFTEMEKFYSGYASVSNHTKRGYTTFMGYIDKKGKEYFHPLMSFEELNWNIKSVPKEIPDSSHLLGDHHYLDFSWNLKTLLNWNLKAFYREPESYGNLNLIDKVCIGYGLLIARGNYSEDYMTKNREAWKIFKEETLYAIVKDEHLREISWNWIKPYYKDAFEKMNPFAQQAYRDCFSYLNQHINNFEEQKYLTYLTTDEANFAHRDINGKIDNKRKLSAFVDRLILQHKVITKEDAKRWINRLYEETRDW